MGVDAGDFDNDGDEDLFITELTGQGHDLYVNDGTGSFDDRSARAGIRLASLPFTGFGAGWIDIDNDGWLDLVTVNGAVTQNIEALARNEPFSLQQKKQLFRNLGNGRFEDATKSAGAVLRSSGSRAGALAFGDIDNDGDLDVVVGNDSGPVRLLDQQHRQQETLGRLCACRSAARVARDRERRADDLAALTHRRQLRVRARSARARRSRRRRRPREGTIDSSRWKDRREERCGDRSVQRSQVVSGFSRTSRSYWFS